MFITNRATPGEILAQLITRPAKRLTNEFKQLRHNDHLCPAFEARTLQILNAYARHHASVDDIQGFTDQGVDVLLQFRDDDGAKHNIGLQIKSYKEIEADLKLKSGSRQLIASLFAQRTRGQSKHQVETFYILLCGDGGVKHADFVRRVKAEFTSLSDTRVITPAEAWSFYNLEDYEIAAYCTKVLCSDDYVLRRARSSLMNLDDEHRRLMIAWVVRQLEGRPRLAFEEMEHYANAFGEDDGTGRVQDSLVKFLGNLQFSSEIQNEDGQHFVLTSTAYPELRALYYDLQVRHELDSEQAMEYLWRLTD